MRADARKIADDFFTSTGILVKAGLEIDEILEYATEIRQGRVPEFEDPKIFSVAAAYMYWIYPLDYEKSEFVESVLVREIEEGHPPYNAFGYVNIVGPVEIFKEALMELGVAGKIVDYVGRTGPDEDLLNHLTGGRYRGGADYWAPRYHQAVERSEASIT